MMAKSICRGMTAALLFVCAATIADARDHSLGSENGPLGNNISTRSYSDAGRGDTYVGSRNDTSSFIVFGINLEGRRSTAKSTTVLAPKAKIIDVDAVAYNNAFAPRNGCVIETGVCVIRGDR